MQLRRLIPVLLRIVDPLISAVVALCVFLLVQRCGAKTGSDSRGKSVQSGIEAMTAPLAKLEPHEPVSKIVNGRRVLDVGRLRISLEQRLGV